MESRTDSSTPEPSVTHYQYRIKCLRCSLHFVVCSQWPNWPRSCGQGGKGSQRYIHCPECGKRGELKIPFNFLAWKVEVPGFIFEHVPGDAVEMYSSVEKGYLAG